MSDHYRVHPLVRAYGKARIEITRQAKNEQEWQKHWRAPQNPFAFQWGDTWKQCVEYKVNDFASEVGFFIDLLGFAVDTFSPSYARLTTPDEDFYFAISEVRPDEQATPAEALRLQFCVVDLEELLHKLEERGILIELNEVEGSSGIKVGSFQTPHGICIDLVDLPSGEVDLDGPSEADSEFDIDEVEGEVESKGEDLIDEFDIGEDEISIESEMDPVELALSQGDDEQEEDYLSPFIKNNTERQEKPAVRRPRVRSAPRINHFDLIDFKRRPQRDGQAGKHPNKPRSNGEITYVEIEDEDEF
ncbi:MAG: hypothetical protein JSV61_12195 [Anaerolineales bacterium]|nr:MAG: hypothetical protein JSV61_12195 [Anaerolineales bacterium]